MIAGNNSNDATLGLTFHNMPAAESPPSPSPPFIATAHPQSLCVGASMCGGHAVEERTHQLVMLLLSSNHDQGVQKRMLGNLNSGECGRLLQDEHLLSQTSRALVMQRIMQLLAKNYAV
jgi:hypothetical protein